MLLSTYKLHQSGTLDNIKIRKQVELVINSYINNPTYSIYSREDIINSVIDECLVDATNNSNELLDFTLSNRHINYLNQLRKDLLNPVESLFVD